MSVSYELTPCAICSSAESDEILSVEEAKVEIEELWEYHARRLDPAVPTTHLMDRVAFSQRAPLRLVRCRALILPGEEDFGLTPLEANAAGRPVVAFARGGALDTVRDGETGVLFHDATSESLEEGLRAVQQAHWNPVLLRAHAETFSEDVFMPRFRSVLATAMEQKKLGRLGADDAA